ncbi:MAG: hypothetical protein P4L76_13390 [Beijerinckiaceae bacterium]|nr:hypothetical protein [Beijerinckiaceae bacterium]
MAKVIMRRNGKMLEPVDDIGFETIAKIPEGREVVADVKMARNPKQLRLFWALMEVIADNVEGIPHKDAAADLVKIATHEVTTLIAPDTGEVSYIPRSIAFESMSQERFNRFLDRALFVITTRWLTGNTPQELRDRVFEIIDGPQAASLGRRAA